MSAHLELPRTDRTRHPLRWPLHLLRPLARFLLRRRYRITVHHGERVPRTGPVLFASNHVGVFDGPLLAIFSPRPVHALTKEEMFEGRLGGVLRFSGQVSQDRFHSDPAAVKAALKVLRDGGAVGIFPEGARGAGDLTRFHRGAAYLAMAGGATVVPVTQIGTREPGGHSGSLPRRGARIELVYGEPVEVPPVPWPRTKDEVWATSRRLRAHMLTQLEAALEETGRSLPGPLPAGEREPDPGGGVTEQSR
jgi:1-acyl-sn-glycerol-3-phosphate acyltransferase